MANDQADFAPEVRNSAWWSGDSRKAVNGKAVDVILTKQGKMPIEDISHLEPVRMGHVMQPVIGRLFQDKHGIELKDADYALSHPTNEWFRSHFDFISTDGRTLVEAKNYNAGVRNKFDADANVVPPSDYAQLIHEAACHGVNDIYLAVLFGGQEFVTFHFQITEQEKDDLLRRMAVFWGHVKSQTVPEAQTIEQSKIVYPIGIASSVTATSQLEMAVTQLKDIKAQIKHLESAEDTLETMIRNAIGDKDTLQSIDGSILATWKNSKSSKRFSSTLFQQAMPDLYEQFSVEQPGARRFLLK